MRRAVLRVAEALAVVQVVLLTVIGAVVGGIYSGAVAGLTGGNAQSAQMVGAFLGGSTGFSGSIALTAFLFTLSAIEENTRTTATMLALVARPRPAPTQHQE